MDLRETDLEAGAAGAAATPFTATPFEGDESDSWMDDERDGVFERLMLRRVEVRRMAPPGVHFGFEGEGEFIANSMKCEKAGIEGIRSIDCGSQRHARYEG